MSTLRILACATLLLPVAGCDDTYDFTCTGKWAKGDKQVSEKVYRYPGLRSEHDATRRCSEDMMKDRPSGATEAKCDCRGE
jgi:hypothetical protein